MLPRFFLAAACLTALSLPGPPASAAEAHKRLRVSLALGTYLPQDRVRSNSTNVLRLQDDQGGIVDQFIDPRNDAGASGALDFQSSGMATLALQYGLTRRLLIEGSVGYVESDLGDIEMQSTPITLGAAVFSISRLPAGTLTRIPIKLSAIYRFRPGFDLSPYTGAGIGYDVIGFEPSDELNRLSLDLDNSTGALAVLSSLENGNFIRPPAPAVSEFLTGATVSGTDSYSWHLIAGAEYAFNHRYSLYADLRLVESTGRFRLGFNNDGEIGSSVPNATVPFDDQAATVLYGPLSITDNGLVDFDGDGQLDPGLYYVQGGSLHYGGFTLQLGVRVQF